MSDEKQLTVSSGQQALSIPQLRQQVDLIQQAMSSVMRPGEHYGVIPGTQKPTLLKAGAEKLGLLFRLIPHYDVKMRELHGGHREYEILCTLNHESSGRPMGEGVGLCSTMESKYRYRNASRQCPSCGNTTIIKGKKEYGGGWLCFAKVGGCGAKFADDDESIIGQAIGKIENPDIADAYNTVLKMAKKRAHVDAMLTAVAASDSFTQDVEDYSAQEQPAETTARERNVSSNSQPTATVTTHTDEHGIVWEMKEGLLSVLDDALDVGKIDDKAWETWRGNVERNADNAEVLTTIKDNVLRITGKSEDDLYRDKEPVEDVQVGDEPPINTEAASKAFDESGTHATDGIKDGDLF